MFFEQRSEHEYYNQDKASMKATETYEQTLQCNKESMANKRNSIMSLEHAILSFQSKWT